MADTTPVYVPTEAELRATAERWGHAHRQSEGCPENSGYRVIPDEWDQDAKAVKDALIEARRGVSALRSQLRTLSSREEAPYSFMDTARVIRDVEGLLTGALVLLYPEVAKWRGIEYDRACVDVLYPPAVVTPSRTDRQPPDSSSEAKGGQGTGGPDA